MAEVPKSLECPICFDIMEAKILICDRGHSFCSCCHRRLKLCPFCGDSMIDTRNLLLEKVVKAYWKDPSTFRNRMREQLKVEMPVRRSLKKY
ncbi:putative E3 ubiquitin-protein ligase sinah-like Protein [Tribolium castaneum]|uniref:Putative E3 ubiquitin-protein ligase sinah-like Protein n=1 Tax=Tribolium castaneum TaxID=7070 RepID=D2A143_TRICA|nr:putative E3 ubiquitin-protein ligase sinah-like Protein [Tribolium castaneum]